ncbi:MAG: PSD1 and planctomycete cytochrome C domain-containing protein [Fuerstiella sp.]
MPVLIRILCIASLGMSADADENVPTAVQLEFFEKEVRPLLVEHCYSCHSTKAKKLQAGLLVDSRAALLRGGDSGDAILPGDADASLLIEAVRYESYEMPPKGKLPAKDIRTLERWVETGAPWPMEDAPTGEASPPDFELEHRKSEHWVWQPVHSPDVPLVTNQSWPRNNIDHFVLARLEEKEITPASDADRSAVLRRLYFGIIGLPPTPEQAANFLNDTSETATETLVDKLLNSPHFGERWGRHWLDLVRYAESRGHEFDNDTPNAFQFRDYIIRALNADVPHDQLVREHIAGDLLSTPRLNPEAEFNESILGTGFWFMGEWVHSPVDIRKDEADRFDNMIDVMSKTFLGVTVSCARCHDHKFDAISTADYYSLSGFLQSSDYRQVRFESLEHNRHVADELASVDAKYQRAIARELDKRGVKLPSLGTDVSGSAANDTKSRAGADSLQGTALIAVDYGAIAIDQYLQDGYLFGKRPKRTGEAYWTLVDGEPTIRFVAEDAAISDPIWNGLESVSEKGNSNRSKLAKLPRSGRILRTPTFTLTSGDVACRVRGAGHVVACVDSHRLIAGPLHGETVVTIKPDNEWTELKLGRYVGHRLHLEFTPDKDTQLEVSLVVQGASPQARQQLSQRAKQSADAVARYETAARRILDEDSNGLVRSWVEEREKLQGRIMLRSRLAMTMMDGTGEDDHVLIRGNASKPGDIEPRHFLTAVTGHQPMKIKLGSGRLELAGQINDPGNPLTARVAANRIWHYLLGRGIVPTTDDFGVLGQRPTDPALLDHLATKFMSEGRSIKRMIRYIVLSRTYQMSSHAVAESIKADPKNLLWHHIPPRRLEGETIRDALLSLSGDLDPTLFGESIPIHLTPFMDGRGRPSKSGPLDGGGRRSIYTAVRRNFLSPFMLTFDTPAPFSTMGRRNVSNVPAQALILMNDPFVVGQAKKWAERAIKQCETTESRVDWLYQTAFARLPTDQEAAVAAEFLLAQHVERSVSENNIPLWADFAHALINTKEFIFLR